VIILRVRLFVTALIAIGTLTAAAARQVPVQLPRTTLTPASTVTLPGVVDSNSPVMWELEDGERKLFVMTSADGIPKLASGVSLDRLTAAAPVTMSPHPGHGVWMEAIVSDEVETWYGFYHNEWPAAQCGRNDRMVSRIGAARSSNRGRTWEDLGPVIQATQGSIACSSTNRYIIGGVGDLSVMLDDRRQYLYLFYSQYQRQAETQGVAVARMRWADRDRPSAAARVDLSSGDAAGGAKPRLARRRRTRRRVLGAVGALEHRARAVCDAAQPLQGRELRAGRHLRLICAAPGRPVPVDATDQGVQRRQVVSASGGLRAHRNG
jgi:hypothetical protein